MPLKPVPNLFFYGANVQGLGRPLPDGQSEALKESLDESFE